MRWFSIRRSTGVSPGHPMLGSGKRRNVVRVSAFLSSKSKQRRLCRNGHSGGWFWRWWRSGGGRLDETSRATQHPPLLGNANVPRCRDLFRFHLNCTSVEPGQALMPVLYRRWARTASRVSIKDTPALLIFRKDIPYCHPRPEWQVVDRSYLYPYRKNPETPTLITIRQRHLTLHWSPWLAGGGARGQCHVACKSELKRYKCPLAVEFNTATNLQLSD